VTTAGIGNGWHVHTSLLRQGSNLLDGDGPHGLSPAGASYVAGILRDLPAIVAITAPSLPSLLRLRPGYFSSAYAFWGIQNREAALRYVPGSPLVGGANANVELKPCDASANPYLALAAVIAAGLAGVEDALTLPEPIQENPGTWTADQRARLGVVRLPQTSAEQDAALRGSARLGEALGAELTGAFLAVRRADAAWGAGKTDEEIVEAHLWRY